MTLFAQAVDVQLKLEVAQSADAGLDLLGRAAKMDQALQEAATYLEAASSLRRKLGLADQPNLDVKGITKAVASFRGGMSSHGATAFQHQPAATLVETARSQRDRCSRWVISRWRQLFADYEALLDRVANERPTGAGSNPVVAQARASNLRALRGLDPVAHRDQINTALKTTDETQWAGAIAKLARELTAALAAIDAEHAALTPEVRAALKRAASSNGLPLDQVSTGLLAALRAAGVDSQLIVRRQ